MIKACIIGVGGYLPETIYYNSDLEKLVDTNEDWITSRTGIKKRHIANHEQLTSDLGTIALSRALKKAHIEASELDGIIVATSTPDIIFPATAVKIQKNIGMRRGFAFDLNAVCAGFIYGLTVANAMIQSGSAKKLALIGAETMSRVVDWKDRNTCVLFGDGAGAVILSATSEMKSEITYCNIHSDSSLIDILKVDGGVSKGNSGAKISMNGKEVFRYAVEQMTNLILEALAKNEISINDVDWILPHQANIRIINAITERLGINNSKVIATIMDHANTSAASIPLALDVYMEEGKIHKGDLVLMVAVGAGMTSGIVVCRI